MEPLLKPALMRNILAFRGLSTSSKRSQSTVSVTESRVIKDKTRGGQKRFASTKDAPERPELAISAHLPLFLRSFEYPQRTAVCGIEEDLHHGEALMRFVFAPLPFLGPPPHFLIFLCHIQEPSPGEGNIG